MSTLVVVVFVFVVVGGGRAGRVGSGGGVCRYCLVL
jgi:hypothetical protein